MTWEYAPNFRFSSAQFIYRMNTSANQSVTIRRHHLHSSFGILRHVIMTQQKITSDLLYECVSEQFETNQTNLEISNTLINH